MEPERKDIKWPLGLPLMSCHSAVLHQRSAYTFRWSAAIRQELIKGKWWTLSAHIFVYTLDSPRRWVWMQRCECRKCWKHCLCRRRSSRMYCMYVGMYCYWWWDLFTSFWIFIYFFFKYFAVGWDIRWRAVFQHWSGQRHAPFTRDAAGQRTHSKRYNNE